VQRLCKNILKMKRSIAFVSLQDQEKQQLEEFAGLTYIERLEYLKFLQTNSLNNHTTAIDIDDIGRNFIVLNRKKNA
jgi:hypothetical protein